MRSKYLLGILIHAAFLVVAAPSLLTSTDTNASNHDATPDKRGTSPNRWESLGGMITSPPTAVSWGTNRLDVFGIGTDGATWQRWWDGSRWQGWKSLGAVGGVRTSPVAVSSGPNKIHLLEKGSDGGIWHNSWTGIQWGGWKSLGFLTQSKPSAVSLGANDLHVLAVGPDGAVWHWYLARVLWIWLRIPRVRSLGGSFVAAPVAISCGPKRIDVFAKGSYTFIKHTAWDGRQ